MKTSATITENGTLLSKLTNKYLAMINTGKLEEKELNALFSHLNGGRSPIAKEERSALSQAMWNNTEGIQLSDAQNLKGIKYLMNLYKTPTGKERLNNPFGYREIAILENFDRFELIGDHDAGNFYRAYYVPLYRVVSKDGATMDYFI